MLANHRHYYWQKYVYGSNILLHEAFCLDKDAKRYKPKQKHHATVEKTAKLAEKLAVDNLVLFHITQQHRKNWTNLFQKTAEKHFSGNVIVAKAFQTLERGK